MSSPVFFRTLVARVADCRSAWFFLLPLGLAGWGVNHGPPVVVRSGTTHGASARVTPRTSAGNVPLRSGASREYVLYSFQGAPDGGIPYGGLLVDKTGALYATTSAGGNGRSGPCFGGGCGTVVKLTPSGNGYTESVIYNFQGGTDGEVPAAGLIADTTGALYGTTANGGNGPCSGGFGCGTVFKLTPSGTSYVESVLYRFKGGSTDGAVPDASVIIDKHGALYGTTSTSGAYGGGTVFKLTPSGTSYTESVLWSFGNGSDGSSPRASLIERTGGKGALYGTTVAGGGACSCGTVFKLTPSGSGYTESILHSFQNGNDGAYPVAGLLAGGKGALYGTTLNGGGAAFCSSSSNLGCGTVFKLTPNGLSYTESILYSFQGGNDGSNPLGGLVSKNGALFGTTANSGPYGFGTVFELTPGGLGYTEMVLHSFKGSLNNDGAYPQAGLIFGHKSAELYGTTFSGGLKDKGIVFKLKG
jgi:uncharacterized repeat protein (TIGR03803 family)